ncbi:MAG: hypothetical protein JXD18_14970 [Anaerolineae bacterium]|nr:hypothetical protein [Anaerolineae bacterium]
MTEQELLETLDAPALTVWRHLASLPDAPPEARERLEGEVRKAHRGNLIVGLTRFLQADPRVSDLAGRVSRSTPHSVWMKFSLPRSMYRYSIYFPRHYNGMVANAWVRLSDLDSDRRPGTPGSGWHLAGSFDLMAYATGEELSRAVLDFFQSDDAHVVYTQIDPGWWI